MHLRKKPILSKIVVLDELIEKDFRSCDLFKPKLTVAGQIVLEHIEQIGAKYVCIQVDNFVIMPNHIHLLLSLFSPINDKQTTQNMVSVGKVVGWFKYSTTKQFNLLNNTVGEKLWQRSYCDHIIRNDEDLKNRYEYIDDNPRRWKEDKYHP